MVDGKYWITFWTDYVSIINSQKFFIFIFLRVAFSLFKLISAKRVYCKIKKQTVIEIQLPFYTLHEQQNPCRKRQTTLSTSYRGLLGSDLTHLFHGLWWTTSPALTDHPCLAHLLACTRLVQDHSWMLRSWAPKTTHVPAHLVSSGCAHTQALKGGVLVQLRRAREPKTEDLWPPFMFHPM